MPNRPLDRSSHREWIAANPVARSELGILGTFSTSTRSFVGTDDSKDMVVRPVAVSQWTAAPNRPWRVSSHGQGLSSKGWSEADAARPPKRAEALAQPRLSSEHERRVRVLRGRSGAPPLLI
jgi:hypothetical protein